MPETVGLDPLPSPDARLRFELVVAPRQITLEPHDGLMTGSFYIAFLQCTSTGRILQTRQEEVNLRLTPSTYQNGLANGLSLSREWAASPGVEELRITVCDGVSGNVGSIMVPLPARIWKDKSGSHTSR